MSYSAKGFVQIKTLIDNTLSTVAGMGELSDLGHSYSKEKGVYSTTAYPTLELVCFSSIETDGVTETKTKLPQSVLDAEFFPVLGTFIDQILNNSAGADLATLAEYVRTQHSSTVGTVEFGSVVSVTVSGATLQTPEWIQFTHPSNENTWRFWLVDASFVSQYDEYEIVVVPPFTPISNFFLAGSAVETLLKAVTVTGMISKMDVAKDDKPVSFMDVKSYDYHNPNKPTQTVYVQALFGLMIYGAAGNNDDAKRQAIADYLSANDATHDRDDWIAILPDVFKRTEFLFVPNWQSYAIPNRTLEAGVYSPFVPAKSSLTDMTALLTDVNATHLETYLTHFTHTYKSLAVALVSGSENRNSYFHLTDVFSDIIMVNTASTDFNRMAAATQAFMIILDRLVQYAESLTTRTALPSGYSRVKRSGKTFVSYSIDNIQYLVYAKLNTTS